MIKQGFLVIIHSYAGDMDDSNVAHFSGLTQEHARWLLHVYDGWYAKCRHDYKSSLKGFQEVVDAACKKLGYIPVDLQDARKEPDVDYVQDYMSGLSYEMFGPSCEYSGRIRTPDKIEMYKIEKDIPEVSSDYF